MIILNKPILNFLKQTYDILMFYFKENNKTNINYIIETILIYYKNIIKAFTKNCAFLKKIKLINDINNLIQFISKNLEYTILNKQLFDNIFNFLYFKKYLNNDFNLMIYSSCSSSSFFEEYEFTKYNKSDKIFFNGVMPLLKNILTFKLMADSHKFKIKYFLL